VVDRRPRHASYSAQLSDRNEPFRPGMPQLSPQGARSTLSRPVHPVQLDWCCRLLGALMTCIGCHLTHDAETSGRADRVFSPEC
jgi:hypothetical protein